MEFGQALTADDPEPGCCVVVEDGHGVLWISCGVMGDGGEDPRWVPLGWEQGPVQPDYVSWDMLVRTYGPVTVVDGEGCGSREGEDTP